MYRYMFFDYSYIYIQFFTGFILGVILGFMLGLRHKSGLSMDKVASATVSLSWLSMHVYGFFFSLTVPTFFDLVGGMAVGHLIGFNASDLLVKVAKR